MKCEINPQHGIVVKNTKLCFICGEAIQRLLAIQFRVFGYDQAVGGSIDYSAKNALSRIFDREEVVISRSSLI